MHLPDISLQPPGEAVLRSIVDDQRHRPCSYPEVGATARDPLPTGYHHLHRSRTLGTGDAVFERAKEGIEQWQAHLGAGLRVAPTDAPVEDGVVAIAVRLGPVWVTAACRVVWTVDEADRFGFAYGTLPHHPEAGEERFVVERRAHDRIVFQIAAFSRGADPVTRLAGPVGRSIQRRATDRYLDALAEWTSATPDTMS